MDKLVWLINDYELTLPRNRRVIWNAAAIKSTPEIIISKDYWFIKWLVDNDKIDRTYFYDLVWNYNLDLVPLPWYDCLLMLLSIQDNPIGYLIDILK